MPIVFQPGRSYEVPDEKPVKQEEEQKKKNIIQTLLSRVAKTKMLVRRGRNDRVLSRSILQNVFQDNFGFDDELERQKKSG